ncbi:hypothetical protein M758_11G115600 [Ceratodon purpureus]|nr:hypothetical protein M758_11G115600 [Ceratodon purpureus]
MNQLKAFGNWNGTTVLESLDPPLPLIKMPEVWLVDQLEQGRYCSGYSAVSDASACKALH